MVISKKVLLILLFSFISFISSAQNDVGVIGLSNPSPGGCYTSHEQVECIVKNFTSNPVDFAVDSLVIYSNCNFISFPLVVIKSGNLAANATMNVMIDPAYDMSAAGNYSFIAISQLNGDTDRWNNTYINTLKAWQNLPQSVDYTDYDGSNLNALFSNWYEAQGVNLPATEDTSFWTSLNIPGTPVNYAARVSMNNSLNRKLHEWIIGPKFKPLLGSSLSFDVAVSAFNLLTSPGNMGNNASLRIMLTADCGVSWQSIYTLNNTSGLTQTFQRKSVDLTSYAGQEISIAFLASDTLISLANSYDLILDNILLMTPVQYDASVTSIINPDNNLGINSDYRVKVIIKNLGERTLDTIPVSFRIGSYTPIDEIWTGSLAKNDSVEYTFSTYIDSLIVNFTVCAYTSLPGDQIVANDEKCKSVATAIRYDAAVSQIITPDDTLGVFSDYRVKVMIKNLGERTLDTIPVSFRIGSYTPIDEIWTGNLAKNESAEFTFLSPIDNLMIDFAICAYTSLPLEQVATNDEKCKTVKGINDSGVEDFNGATFSLGNIYPNPASSEVIIPVCVQGKSHIVFKLINIFGQTMMQKDMDLKAGNNNIWFNLDAFKSGIYFISAECSDGIAVRKLIVQ